MRTYEALFIVQPNATDDEVQTIATGVETLITGDGGAIVRSEIWGKRRLAYEVKGFAEGIYVLVRFDSDASIIKKLDTSFHLNEEVIRYLNVLFDEKTLRMEAKQIQQNEAQLEKRSQSDDDDDDDDDIRPRRSSDV